MKNSQLYKIIGAAISVVGTVVLIYGYQKFKEATGVIKALTTSQFSDTTSLRSISIWEQYKQTWTIITAIGAVILVVGIVFFLSGVFKANAAANPEDPNSIQTANNTKTEIQSDIHSRLAKLDSLKSSGVITEEEYDEKRKKIIDEL